MLNALPMTARLKRNSPPGFTLVELLVVMAIIAILVAVSVPAYTMAIMQANKAKCAANLRNIGVGMLAFAGDNNGNLPESGGVIPYNSIDSTTKQNGWTQQLEPYMGAGSAMENSSGTSVYQCPDRGLVSDNKYYSYFNGAHAADPNPSSGGTFGPVCLLKMHAQSQHIIAGDIGHAGVFTVDDADKDDYGANNPAFGSAIVIHGGSVNLLFGDGHVENARSYDNTRMTTHYEGIVNETYTQ
jgi:prepilin-type N-terminal cleavage/methylation domain-containing protein/prepilin-type processing-associated H-X9-DG protein